MWMPYLYILFTPRVNGQPCEKGEGSRTDTHTSLAAMQSVEELAQALMREKVAAAEAELANTRRAHHALLAKHSHTAYLQKRGGAAKTWKRR